MIEKLLACLMLASQFLVVAIGGHYFFVKVIVREQHTECKGGGGAFCESHDTARKAFSLFAEIRSCSLLIVGFAVNVAVIGGLPVDPMIRANSMRQRASPFYFSSNLPGRHHFSMTPG
jgi:hypothetical protein